MTAIAEPTLQSVEAGWFPDPTRQHDLRYHDGTDWTDHVTHFGPTPCQGCRQDDRRANS